MIRAFRVLAFASITCLGFGQSKETILPSSRAQALADVIGGFNAIGPRASILRRAMKPEDALAFDGVLEDVMGAHCCPRQDRPVARPAENGQLTALGSAGSGGGLGFIVPQPVQITRAPE